ncbi:MAG: AAA family ATPase [Telluria sp.]
MSGIRTYKSLGTLVSRLRDDLNQSETESKKKVINKPATILLLYAYNRTGKTRLSMEFKDAGKRKTKKNPAGNADTLYFNAFTEDLFTWENDLEGDSVRQLLLNKNSKFFEALNGLALDQTIAVYLSRYTDFEFDIDYESWKITFRKVEAENIKISRGEQNIFVWCLFMAICERMLDGHESYQWVKFLYIDDPISSLDDNNAISVACDLAKLLRRAASRKDSNGAPAPIKIIFSSHHALFFNVMCNEIGRSKEGEPKVTHKRYFLHRPNGEGGYTLRATEDTPFFHHVATLAELKRAADLDNGKLYTFHFNALRSIMEKTASFFGHSEISFCLKALENEDDRALYNRALNLLSHGKYAIQEPTEMGDDNKDLFRRILGDFVTKFQFALPDIVKTSPAAAAPAPAPAPEETATS